MKQAFVNATAAVVALLFALQAIDVRSIDAAEETDARLHSDGPGWRLDQAKIVDRARPRVLLIGDSILNGYLKAVTASLDGKAYVDARVNPYAQSEHLNKLLAEVLAHGPYDVVHFNMGLHGWQAGRIKPGTFEPLTKQYVEVIRDRLPKARIIWASSTPVTVKGEPTALDPEINPIILEHNRLAAKVMRELHVPVNDFYSLLAPQLQWARGDQFHWKLEGYQLLAQTVTSSVLRELGTTRVVGSTNNSVVRPFKDQDVVCFVGDSITRGGGYHANVFQFYATRFPAMKLQFFNCGRSGDNAVGTLQRLPWDCLQHHPNVAVVMLGMNDSVVGPTQDQPIANLEKLIRALQDAGCRVIQVAPTIYDESVPVETKVRAGKNAALTDYSARVREMAHRLGNEFVDFNTPMQRINDAQQKLDPKFTLIGTDRVHPGPVGHLVMAYEFLKAQAVPGDVSSIVVDATTGKAGELLNCKVDTVQSGPDGLSFTCTEQALPFIPDEKALAALELVPFMEELNRQTLLVRGLSAGNYQLSVDDQPVGEFTAEQLTKGINLAGNSRMPQYQQALRVAGLNGRRHDIESNQMRGVAFVHGSLRKAGIDPQDKPAAEKFLRDFIAAHKDEQGNFGKTMYERYLSSWDKDESKNLAVLKELGEQMKKDAQPVAHSWKLTKVK